jgi:hypothetical protein
MTKAIVDVAAPGIAMLDHLATGKDGRASLSG